NWGSRDFGNLVASSSICLPCRGRATGGRPAETIQKQHLSASSRSKTHRKLWTVDSRLERRDVSAPNGSRRHELHLLERRAAEEAVGTGEGFVDLEMVVALREEILHGFPRRLDRSGEVARLALELRRLESSSTKSIGRPTA